LVLEGCVTRGIPVVVTLGGGYARQVSDTVRIHANTCALALELAAAAGPAAPGPAPEPPGGEAR
jgi:acetoin utilization deacetylase AcuC-like enzyme